mmetsp:Transcript_25697/g.30153  ORF Transcript_25697/g.30153 Transcript_25697/m.30153 type:complete len:116 (-) Transcript_25697:890-1237(-)
MRESTRLSKVYRLNILFLRLFGRLSRCLLSSDPLTLALLFLLLSGYLALHSVFKRGYRCRSNHLLFVIELLLHVEMLLENLVLAKLLLVGLIFASFLLLFGTEARSLLFIGRLAI